MLVYCTYRGYRIEGILYGEQKNLVATVGVVSVGRPGDSFRCGVIKVRLLTWVDVRIKPKKAYTI